MRYPPIVTYCSELLPAFYTDPIPEDTRKEILFELQNKLDFNPMILRDKTIPEIAAVIDKSNLFISNDTGIMHVAGATTCPLISLFGPTNPMMWSPIGKKKYFIKNSNDINSIKVDDVLKLAEGILNETN